MSSKTKKNPPARSRPASVTQISISSAVRMANRWRDQLNPLRGLTINRCVGLLELAQRGQLADLQWTFRFIERRDPTLRALKARRRSAMLKLDWNIKTVDEEKLPAGFTVADAEAQANRLREAYDAIDNFRDALKHLALAEFRGYAHLEKHVNADGDCFHLEPVEQWFWNRVGCFGEWLYNRDAASTSTGERIDLANFLIRECDDPIDEIALIAFVRKTMSQKDWDGFIETYGIPPLFLIAPPNTGTDLMSKFQEIAEEVVSDGRGALPNGSDIKSPPAAERGTNPFRDHIQYQDEQVVLAGTGGKLTMLAESGSGTLAGGAHQDAWDEIAQGEAAEISEIFQQQFDAPLLMAAFPSQPVLAYFELAANEEVDVRTICEDVQKLSSAGYRIDAGQLSEKTGYQISEKETPSTDPQQLPVPVKNRAVSEQLLDNSRDLLARSMASDLFPIRKRLERIMQIDDPEIMANRLRAFQSDLPALLKDISADPAAAAAIEQALSAGLITGLTTKPGTEPKEAR